MIPFILLDRINKNNNKNKPFKPSLQNARSSAIENEFQFYKPTVIISIANREICFPIHVLCSFVFKVC